MSWAKLGAFADRVFWMLMAVLFARMAIDSFRDGDSDWQTALYAVTIAVALRSAWKEHDDE